MATRKSGKKRAAAEINRMIERYEVQIEKQRKTLERQGYAFSAPTREELREQLSRSDSPYILWAGWVPSVTSGGLIEYKVAVTNPDPYQWSFLAVEVSVRKPTNNNRLLVWEHDARFPTLAPFAPSGFILGQSESDTETKVLTFELKTPTSIEKTGYFGHAVLFEIPVRSNMGRLFDYGTFFFSLS